MDEPTSALAEREVEWLFRLIADLRAKGICIVFTSHRWNEIKGIADRITIFRNGESIGIFPATNLSEETAVELMTGRKLDMYYPSPPPLEVRTPALEVRGVRGQGVSEATFTAQRGEILGIGGLAGQGQRELFLTLFGVNHAAGGSVRIEGQAAHIGSPRDAIRAGMGIALIPEDRKTEGLLLPRPIRQNLTLPILARIARGGFIRRGEEAVLIRQIVQQLDIRASSIEQPVGALSGGNQQKVLIGRWLLSGAKILLLYDITRGVDVATKHDIYELMLRLSSEGRTLLFYSTDTEELAHVCHRILVMREGRFVAELSGEAITPKAIVAASIREPDDEPAEVPA
jgi:ribose transport system ATP-binding protein